MGLDQTPDLSDRFNTRLSSDDEAKYQAWGRQQAGTRPDGRNPAADTFDYDMRGFWKSGNSFAGNGHAGDQWKKPNHPTFSNLSQYQGPSGNVPNNGPRGGTWSGGEAGAPWSFTPSQTNLEMHDPAALQRYFEQEEKGNTLDMPKRADGGSLDDPYEGASQQYGVDATLLRALTGVESGDNDHAVSPQGARGRAQFLPQTAAEMGVTDTSDKRQSIYGAARYLRQNFDLFGRPDLAVAAYHGGPNTDQWGPKTRDYVDKIVSRYSQMKGARAMAPTPAAAQAPPEDNSYIDSGTWNLPEEKQAPAPAAQPGVTIDQVRQKYPQYKDLSDEQLAQGLHKKFYADLPFDQFAGKIGYRAPTPEQAATARADQAMTPGQPAPAASKKVTLPAAQTDEGTTDYAPPDAQIPQTDADIPDSAAKRVLQAGVGGAKKAMEGATQPFTEKGEAWLADMEAAGGWHSLVSRAVRAGVVDFSVAASIPGAVFNAGQKGLDQFGQEIGVPGLGPAVGAFMEAFPQESMGQRGVLQPHNRLTPLERAQTNPRNLSGYGTPAYDARKAAEGAPPPPPPPETPPPPAGGPPPAAPPETPTMTIRRTRGSMEREALDELETEPDAPPPPESESVPGPVPPPAPVPERQTAPPGEKPNTEAPPPDEERPAPTRIRTIQQIQDQDGVSAKKAGIIQQEEIAAVGRPITTEERDARAAGVAAKKARTTSQIQRDEGVGYNKAVEIRNAEKAEAETAGPEAEAVADPEPQSTVTVRAGDPISIDTAAGRWNKAWLEVRARYEMGLRQVEQQLARGETPDMPIEQVRERLANAEQRLKDPREFGDGSRFEPAGEAELPPPDRSVAGDEATNPGPGIPREPIPDQPLYEKAKEPQRLINFLRQKTTLFKGTINERTIPGGIQPGPGGDLAAIIGGHKGRPGLISKRGRSLWDATVHAWENGYFPEYPPNGERPPDERILLDAIEQDHTGSPRYSIHDAEDAQAYQDTMARNEEIDRLASDHEIPTEGLTRSQFFDQLADKISLDDAVREMQSHADAQEAAYRETEEKAKEWAKQQRSQGVTPKDIYGQSQARTLADLENEHREIAASETATAGEQRAPGDGEPGSAAGDQGDVSQGAEPRGDSAGAGRRDQAPGLEAPGRRSPKPPVGGPDLFGDAKPQAERWAPEPTIKGDARQQTMPGMEPTARQAQASRDAAGPRGDQLPANEGLFGRAETHQPELPTEAPKPVVSRFAHFGGPQFTDLLHTIKNRMGGHEEAARWVLERGRETGHEHIAIVDNATGEIIHAGTDHEKAKITFDFTQPNEATPDSLTVHHNHPRNGALSGPDFGMLAWEPITHVIAVGHGGDTFVARLGPELRGERGVGQAALETFHRLNQMYLEVQDSILGKVQALLEGGKLDVDSANRMLYDATNHLLHRMGALDLTSTRVLPLEGQRIVRGFVRDGSDARPRSEPVQPPERFAGLHPPVRSDTSGAARPGANVRGDPAPQAGTGGGGAKQGRLLEGGLAEPDGAKLYSFPGALFDLNAWRRALGLPQMPPAAALEILRDKRGIARAVAEIKAALAPTSLRGAAPMEQAIRAHTGRAAQAYDHAFHALEDVRLAVDRMSRDEQVEFTDRMERGAAQPTPELQAVADTLRATIDDWARRIQGLGKGYLANAIDNYMGHIWGNYDEWAAQRQLQLQQGQPGQTQTQMQTAAISRNVARQPLRGSGAFLKERFFPTQLEGIQAGLIPATYNPVDLQLIKIHEMQKFYHGTVLADQLKQTGLATWVRDSDAREAGRNGFVKLDDAVFQPKLYGVTPIGPVEPGAWYSPEPMARVFNNYMSRGWSGRSSIYDAFRRSNNALNSLQLGFSGFHAAFVTADTTISKFALGLQQMGRVLPDLRRGDFAAAGGHALRGASSMAQGTVLGAPYTVPRTAMRGGEMRRAWLDPAGATPEMRQIVEAYKSAGGRMEMPEFFRTANAGAFFKTLGDLANPSSAFYAAAQMFRDAPGPFQKAVMTPLRIAGRLIDTLNQPLMGALVPRMKMGVFADLAQDWLRENPAATSEQAAAAMIKIQDTVDNRLGQLNYDNLFWNKVAKDIAFVTTRSVGWNVGTVREIGGGFVDSASAIKAIANGRAPAFTARMAYTIALPIVTAQIGALLTYMATGQGPQTMLDYFYPPTGTDTGQGAAERRAIPGYMKDVIAFWHAPLQTVENKMSPLLETIQELTKNKDYYGGIIYDRERDAGPAQAYGDYLLNQVAPFTLRGINRLNTEGASKLDQMMAFWGFQPAPKSITQPQRGEAFQRRDSLRAYKQRTKEHGRMEFFNAPSP